MVDHKRGGRKPIIRITGRTAGILTGTTGRVRQAIRQRVKRPFYYQRTLARAHGGGLRGYLRGQRTVTRSLTHFVRSAARSKRVRRGGR